MNTQNLPIDTQGDEIYCWSDIKPEISYGNKCVFYDGSKGQPDPRFHYTAIGPDQVPGYDPGFMVFYFDKNGTWITQSVFETIEEAIDHCVWLFQIEEYEWFWQEPHSPESLGLAF
jgi:hypothetical protein